MMHQGKKLCPRCGIRYIFLDSVLCQFCHHQSNQVRSQEKSNEERSQHQEHRRVWRGLMPAGDNNHVAL